MATPVLPALVAALAALAVAAAGCGADGEGMSSPPEAGETGTAANENATTEPAPPRRYRVWFAREDALAPVSIDGEAREDVAAAALELLLAGPPTGEGLDTAIPAGTRLLGIDLDGGLATVDLSAEFESGGGSRSMFVRLAQVVFTVTEFETIERVRFRLDGRPVEVFSAEGIVLDDPVGRKDYEELLPAILVESPTPGEAVSSPVTVSGSANVFEANVTVRVLGADGRELAHTFTTATCGTGCRGGFSVAVAFEVGKAEPGTIVVHDDDAAGTGRPLHEVRIPVRLAP
jgi:germination protein M